MSQTKDKLETSFSEIENILAQIIKTESDRMSAAIDIDDEDKFLKISREFRNNRKKLKIWNERVRELKSEIINDDIMSGYVDDNVGSDTLEKDEDPEIISQAESVNSQWSIKVRDCMRALEQSNYAFHAYTIRALSSPERSKDYFGINNAFFNREYIAKKYWKESFSFNDEIMYLTSDWDEQCYRSFKQWFLNNCPPNLTKLVKG